MIRGLIESFGVKKFQRLLQLFSEGASGESIADEFGVSRERVRHWKSMFGQVVSLYVVHPEVSETLNEILAEQNKKDPDDPDSPVPVT